MKRSISLWALLVVGMMAVSGSAALVKEAKAPQLKTLGPGTYQATVKAIVCEGCSEFIQSTMTKNEAIENVRIDQKTRQVKFDVKFGNKVQFADLQDSLKTSANEMGMGADYTLVGLKKI
jgi:hypothetical protein